MLTLQLTDEIRSLLPDGPSCIDNGALKTRVIHVIWATIVHVIIIDFQRATSFTCFLFLFSPLRGDDDFFTFYVGSALDVYVSKSYTVLYTFVGLARQTYLKTPAR